MTFRFEKFKINGKKPIFKILTYPWSVTDQWGGSGWAIRVELCDDKLLPGDEAQQGVFYFVDYDNSNVSIAYYTQKLDSLSDFLKLDEVNKISNSPKKLLGLFERYNTYKNKRANTEFGKIIFVDKL